MGCGALLQGSWGSSQLRPPLLQADSLPAELPVGPSLSRERVSFPFGLRSSHRMDSTLPLYASSLAPAPTNSAEGFEVQTALCSPLPSCPPPSSPGPWSLSHVRFSQDIQIVGSQSLGFSSHYLQTLEIPRTRWISPPPPPLRPPLFLSNFTHLPRGSWNEVQTEGCQSFALELLVIASPLSMLTNTPGLSLSQDPLKWYVPLISNGM